MGDANSFRLEIERFITREVPQKVVETQRLMVNEALTLIVQATPVGNNTKWKANVGRIANGLAPLPKGYVGGHARKNWRVSVGSQNLTTTSGQDATGQAALSTGSIREPTIVWISNPLAYMQPLEDGWSKQAPTGMVANAVRLITAKYARVA